MVRLELIEFLLAHDQRSRAVSELVAMTSDLPDDISHHLRVARLFARAGDTANALQQFESVLRLDADNSAALTGGGYAAFALGDYALARRRLQRAPSDAPETRSTLELADLVLSRDPLATRIGSGERRRRFAADFAYAAQRLAECLAAAGGQLAAGDADLQTETMAFADALKDTPVEQDTIESGIDLIERVERRVVERCGPATPMDRALLLIAHEHGAEAQ
jgi:tetratricopeptide (TPR) repeat protein